MIITDDDIKKWLKKNNIEMDSSLVKGVNMDMYEVSTKEKPVLFTLGLSTCIGLVAVSKDFSFLAHIDMGYGVNSFEQKYIKLANGKWDSKKESCKVTRELYNIIYRKRNELSNSVELTVVLGEMPVDVNESSRVLLETGIENVIKMCKNNLGITVERKPDENASAVLVDSRNRVLQMEPIYNRLSSIDLMELSKEVLKKNPGQLSSKLQTIQKKVKEKGANIQESQKE